MSFEERFSSLNRVYGEELMQVLREAHVCIIGIGGVGSWAVEALARTGIGKMTLVDGDAVSVGNMNRQIHTLDTTLGRLKVEVMCERVARINPACNCAVVGHHIDDDNLRDIIERGYDVVIDCIDSIRFKAAIIYCCRRNRIPVVTTGGAGGLHDPARVEVADLARTWNDPLAATVRSRLRHKYGYTRNPKRTFGVPCVYSPEQQRYPDADGEPVYCKPGVAGLTLDCNYGYGSSVMVTATFGFTAVSKAVELIARKKLTGKR